MREKNFATKVVKKLSAALLLFVVSVPAFSIEPYVTDIYKEIDTAFTKRSDDSLNIVLQKNQDDKYYYLIENYATKKIRRLIVTNDYEFAMSAILVIIDNDMENEEAVEMYSAISDAYAVQKAYEERELQRQQKEKERLAALKEQQRTSAEKEYKAIKADDGTSVFVTGKDAKLSSYNWDFHMGFIPGMMLTDNIPVFQVGVLMDFDYIKMLTNLTWGFNIYGEAKFLNLALPPDEYSCQSLFGDLEIIPKFAYNGFSKHAFLRVGLVMDANLDPTKDRTALTDEKKLVTAAPTLITPAVGFEFSKVPVGNTEFKVSMDYYPGHFWTKDLNFAAGMEAKFTIPFADADRFKLSFDLGFRDKLYVRSSGIDNRSSLIFALGAQNVIR